MISLVMMFLISTLPCILYFQCPGFKLDSDGKPDPNLKVDYADEAKYFTETRLLHQDIEIVLDSVNNNNFVGTIIHPVSKL